MWPIKFYKLIQFILLLILVHISTCSRVYELTDKFLQAYKSENRLWLVKFYAPWCHFCKDLEPIYMQVAQRLANEGSSVVVGRLDCTKYTNIDFPIHGFPTILFISKDYVVEFDGDRSIDEITDFARRLSGPAIRSLVTCDGQLKKLLNNHKVLFLHISLNQTWPDYYVQGASKYRSLNWFYGFQYGSCGSLSPGTYVLKKTIDDVLSIKYQVNDSHISFDQWIQLNRFPQFVKVTQGVIPHLLKTGKFYIYLSLFF